MLDTADIVREAIYQFSTGKAENFSGAVSTPTTNQLPRLWPKRRPISFDL
jgi:hypothetical protein